jgi:hypothetical protein
MASEVKANKWSPGTGVAGTLGDSGDTFTVPSGATLAVASGATIANSGTATGFSEAAYAANASASTGAVNVDASNNLQFNSGYGSTATAYGCRAWVNFNGSGTPAIRDSGNVSSITDNGTGNYDVNFSSAMPDANYVISGVSGESGAMANHRAVSVYNDALQTTYCEIKVGGDTSTHYDDSIILIAVFR